MMSRMMLFVVLASTVCLALGQTISPSSSMSVTTTLVPKPTPVPPKPSNSTNATTYILMDDNDNQTTCLRLDAYFSFIFAYNTTVNGTRKNISVPFENNTMGDGSDLRIDYETSMCNSTTPKAILVVKYTPANDLGPYYLNLSFKGSRVPGNQAWQFDQMSVNFTYHSEMFPSYHGNQPMNNSKQYSYTNQSLFDDTNKVVELTRQYICEKMQTFKGFSALTSDNSFIFLLNSTNLEVQAFNFSNNGNTTNFSPRASARVCLLDNNLQGNVVVPIAVGAALGVLVVIVLIAYLIARIRNKKKGSYEALSS